MKAAGWFAVGIGFLGLVLAIVTAIGNISATGYEGQTGFPWQATVGIETVVALLFFLPGLVLISRKHEQAQNPKTSAIDALSSRKD